MAHPTDASIAVPMIAYWMGEPLTKLPRKKLYEIISEQARELADARDREMRNSISRVNELAALARDRTQYRYWWEKF